MIQCGLIRLEQSCGESELLLVNIIIAGFLLSLQNVNLSLDQVYLCRIIFSSFSLVFLHACRYGTNFVRNLCQLEFQLFSYVINLCLRNSLLSRKYTKSRNTKECYLTIRQSKQYAKYTAKDDF